MRLFHVKCVEICLKTVFFFRSADSVVDVSCCSMPAVKCGNGLERGLEIDTHHCLAFNCFKFVFFFQDVFLQGQLG